MALASQESVTISEAAISYVRQLSSEEQLRNQSEVNRFVRWVGSDRLSGSLSSHEVASYAESLGTTTVDIGKKLEPVKVFLAYLKKEGYTATNLGPSLRPIKHDRSAAKTSKVAQEDAVYLTEEGYQQLVAELDTLKAERPRIAETLRQAMADKDFRENAPLDAARDQQAHTEARIRQLESVFKRVKRERLRGEAGARAQLGSSVLLWDIAAGEALRFTLVHPNEVNAAQGKISVASPLGKALLGRIPTEEFTVEAPAGLLQYRVQAVEAVSKALQAGGPGSGG